YIGQLQALGANGAKAWSIVDGIVTRESLTMAVNDVFLLCAVLFFAMIPIVWIAKPPFGNQGAASVH
ncbi:MAG: MFS transporter, partial [Xanthomonadaceae bacterium]|nr:MFS transporter [Xanthomonadaceae bacterium]